MMQATSSEKQADISQNGQEAAVRQNPEPKAWPKLHSHSNQALLRRGRAGAAPPKPPLRPSQAFALQRKANNPMEEPTRVPHVVHEVLNSPGQPLDSRTRSFMEQGFGRDFSGVRIHNDGKSAESAKAVNAKAYTVGNQVFFAAGHYQPQMTEGKLLLAHELAHVVQQRDALGALPALPQPVPANAGQQSSQGVPLQPKLVGIGEPQDSLERQADAVAHAVVTNQPGIPQIDTASAPLVQRDAGGVKQSKYGDIDVDVMEGFILGGKWQDAMDTLNNMPDNSRILKVLNDLKQISAPSGQSLLETLLTNKPATTPARLNPLLDQADNSVSLRPEHSDERIENRDKLAIQTFTAIGDPIPDVIVAAEQEPNKPPKKRTLTKEFSIFVPKAASPGRNQVHIFFTPFVASGADAAAGFVAEQGLRAESDASAWILIAVPALNEPDNPNFVTISTAEIQNCLTAALRNNTKIDAIRLSAHSRGHRGLENTIGLKPGSKPLIDPKLVEKVTVFDASYHDLGTALTSHQKELTAMADPTKPGQFAPGAVQLYDVTVTVGNIPGLPGIKLDVRGIRAISYARLIKEGTALGMITPTDINSIDPVVSDAINRILAKLPDRGNFSSKKPLPSGKENVQDFIKNNNADLMLIDSAKVKGFIKTKHLDGGQNFSMTIDAHHWFVAELAHEAVE